MKEGLSLQELATEIERQRTAKEDFTAPSHMLAMSPNGRPGTFEMELRDIGSYTITDHTHRQMGNHLNIPARYYDRMRTDAPELLAENVNHWLTAQPEMRLIRTLDGNMRGFLSDRYRAMDNAELAEAVLPALRNAGARVASADISDTKLYIKAVVDGKTVTVPPPAGGRGHGFVHDVEVQPGIVISNSEVGAGAVAVQPAVHTLACTNMAIWADQALKKRHLGRRLASDNERIWQYMSDRTVKLADQALWSEVRDVTEAALSGQLFDDIVEQLTAARTNVFPATAATGVIEKLSNSRGLSESEQESVLSFLIEGGDLSQYGVQAAVTQMSQEVGDYGRATELEALGGEIIFLGRRDWEQLVQQDA